jgi:hypothetical protein
MSTENYARAVELTDYVTDAAPVGLRNCGCITQLRLYYATAVVATTTVAIDPIALTESAMPTAIGRLTQSRPVSPRVK